MYNVWALLSAQGEGFDQFNPVAERVVDEEPRKTGQVNVAADLNTGRDKPGCGNRKRCDLKGRMRLAGRTEWLLTAPR